MKIGIRAKLIVLMAAVALLPLLAGLMTILMGGRHLQNETFGTGMLSLVNSEAHVMEREIRKDIDLLNVALHDRDVITQLQAVKAPRPAGERKRLDDTWETLSVDDPVVRNVLQSEIAQILQRILRENTMMVELQVTDRFGQLQAATQRTSDYDQADEAWWQECYNDGDGRIYVPYIDYDFSASVWGIDICVPIIDGGKTLGVVKAVLAVNRWLPDCRRESGAGSAFVEVVGRNGLILHSQGILEGRDEPDVQRHPQAERILAVPREGEWSIDQDEIILAYAPIHLPSKIGTLDVEMSRWMLVLSMPLDDTRQGLGELTMMILLIGLGVIVVLFIGGVLLIDRTIINRIRRIGQSARLVAQGDLQHRANARWRGTRLIGVDEIDDLARDFNDMVRRLQRSHTELINANDLKENFIRIAGHELRTPVSYIVGMASLMKQCKDPERLAKAIDTMGFKAGRLDEIIQAMFKLIPEQALTEELAYSSISLQVLLTRISQDAQPWLERRHQTLHLNTGERDTILQADEAKLGDVIENVVMNAIKFTPDGGSVWVDVQRQLGGYVAIEVRDEGPGVPESDRPHVFEPFYSGSDVLRHSTGKSGYGKKGMGLGLAIAKHFIDLHGGRITFTTGKTGTTFVIQLPIARHDEHE